MAYEKAKGSMATLQKYQSHEKQSDQKRGKITPASPEEIKTEVEKPLESPEDASPVVQDVPDNTHPWYWKNAQVLLGKVGQQELGYKFCLQNTFMRIPARDAGLGLLKHILSSCGQEESFIFVVYKTHQYLIILYQIVRIQF